MDFSNSGRLFRYLPSRKSDTVVLVGNGATINGSKPIDSFVDGLTPNFSDTDDADFCRRNLVDKTHIIASLSFRFRAARLDMFRKIEKLGGVSSWNWSIHPVVGNFITTRKNLANCFSSACQSGLLSLRNDVNLKTPYFNPDDSFITTNWDSLLWQKAIPNLIQLHGICTHPESMVLPSELLTDDLWIDAAKIVDATYHQSPNHPTTQHLISFLESYRWNFVNELSHLHDLCGEWLGDAKRIVIWGLGLNTYDAELTAQLATYTQPDNLDEVVVIDPNSAVVEKAISLIGIKKSKVRHVTSL